MSIQRTKVQGKGVANRRTFLGRLGVAAGIAGVGLTLRPRLHATGALLAASADPEVASRDTGFQAGPFDDAIQEILREHRIPGGALAVVRKGVVVHKRGFGWARRETQTPAEADTRFRIASLTKPITALAILKSMESGRLDLDLPVWEGLGLDKFRPAGSSWDKRWQAITVRHLLHHTGGWDREKSQDPMFRSRHIAKTLGLDPPPEPWDVIRFMAGMPLDFNPGERYAYSNFGYCLLGRVLEKVAGKPYEQMVQEELLRPLGVHGMRLGATLASRQSPEEATYYMPDNETTESLGPGEPATVPVPYGGFWLETMDAHGGWIASVSDLARVTAALDSVSPQLFARQETFERLIRPPPAPAFRNAKGALEETYYTCGWMVRPRGAQNRPNAWHNGSLPGTTSTWVRRGDGLSYVALFNQRAERWQSQLETLDRLLAKAADRTQSALKD